MTACSTLRVSWSSTSQIVLSVQLLTAQIPLWLLRVGAIPQIGSDISLPMDVIWCTPRYKRLSCRDECCDTGRMEMRSKSRKVRQTITDTWLSLPLEWMIMDHWVPVIKPWIFYTFTIIIYKHIMCQRVFHTTCIHTKMDKRRWFLSQSNVQEMSWGLYAARRIRGHENQDSIEWVHSLCDGIVHIICDNNDGIWARVHVVWKRTVIEIVGNDGAKECVPPVFVIGFGNRGSRRLELHGLTVLNSQSWRNGLLFPNDCMCQLDCHTMSQSIHPKHPKLHDAPWSDILIWTLHCWHIQLIELPILILFEWEQTTNCLRLKLLYYVVQTQKYNSDIYMHDTELGTIIDENSEG